MEVIPMLRLFLLVSCFAPGVLSQTIQDALVFPLPGLFAGLTPSVSEQRIVAQSRLERRRSAPIELWKWSGCRGARWSNLFAAKRLGLLFQSTNCGGCTTTIRSYFCATVLLPGGGSASCNRSECWGAFVANCWGCRGNNQHPEPDCRVAGCATSSLCDNSGTCTCGT